MTYRLSGRAQADLAEIWDDSAQHWGLDQADRSIDALVTRFAWLGENAAEVAAVRSERREPSRGR